MDSKVEYYILVGRTVVVVDVVEWGRWFESARDKRRIGDNVINGVRISTVFLGLDHNYLPYGPPLIFESMIFGGVYDQHQVRYSTYDQAEVGHAQLVDMIKRTPRYKNWWWYGRKVVRQAWRRFIKREAYWRY